ncbi:MAG: AI-2E family transporter [Gloeobacterales cyanobacterium]
MTSPQQPSSWQQLNNSKLLRFLLLFACGWALLLLIGYFYSIIAIFTAAAIIAVLLNFPMQQLSRYLPRSLAITIVFLIALASLVGFVTVLGLELVNQGQGLLSRSEEALKTKEFLPFKNFLDNLDLGFDKIIQPLQSGLSSGLGVVQTIFSSTFTVIFTFVISLYMLISGERLWNGALKVIPANYRDRFAAVFQQSFLGFLRGQMLLLLFLSTTCFLAFSLFGVNYALLLAVIMGVIDAIPGIGGTLGVVVISALTLTSQGWQTALLVVIISIVLQQIQDNFISPKVMGDALELNPVLMFLAIFIGERVAGVLGIFLALPIAGMIAAWLRTDELISVPPVMAPSTSVQPSPEPSAIKSDLD